MKKMQFFLMMAGSLLILAQNAHAQKDSSGIYKTANDFIAGKLSLAINCATEKHKIKLNDFFGKDHITVAHEGKPYDFKKSDVFGFRLCNGETYRFSGNKDYLVLNPKEMILLYKVEVPQPKAASPKKYNYYFSKDANSPIQDLTKENVKAAFPDNHKFHDALDENFKTDTDLASYDTFHKMYKVNHILEMSTK